MAEADGRPADGEVGRAAQLGAGVGEGQRPGGRPVPVRGASLDELRRPERDQAGERRVFTAERFRQGDRALERALELRGGVAVPGVERCGHGLQNLELAPVPVFALRQAAHDRQRLLVQPDRLGVGEHARGELGGAAVVGHRPARPPAARVLPGELSRDGVRVVGVQELEGLGHPAVQQPPLRRAYLRVCRLPEQVVGEVVAVAELAHDPAPPQLVDRSHHGAGVEVARLREQFEGEVRAHRRREAGHLPGRRARLLQPVAQHGRQIPGRPGGTAGTGIPGTSTAGISTAGTSTPGPAPPGPAPPRSTLPRTASMTYSGKPPVVACSRSASSSGSGWPEIASARRAVSAASSGLRESSVSSPVARIRTVQSASSGVLVRTVVARGRGHQDRGAGGEAQEERDEGQRLLVAPLHVVQDEQQWPPDGDQGPREALEEPVPLPGVHHGPRAGLAFLAPFRRDEPAHLGAPGRVQRRRGGLDGGAAQPVRHRRQGQPARCPEALAAGHHRAVQPCHRGDLGRDAGLADAGPAPDHREAGTAGRGGPPEVLKQAELPRPADELPGGEAGAGGGGLNGRPARALAASPLAIRRWKARRVAGSGTTPSSRSRTDAQWW